MKNPTQLLNQAAAFPAALEAKLPAGSPKISVMLLDTAGKLPVLPDLMVEVPDLPAPPAIPDFTPPGGNSGLKTLFANSVTLTPVQEKTRIIPSPAAGVLPEVRQRRSM